jgi:hypothetical protein
VKEITHPPLASLIYEGLAYGILIHPEFIIVQGLSLSSLGLTLPHCQ